MSIRSPQKEHEFNSGIVEYPNEKELKVHKLIVDEVNNDREEFDAKQIMTGCKLIKLNTIMLQEEEIKEF